MATAAGTAASATASATAASTPAAPAPTTASRTTTAPATITAMGTISPMRTVAAADMWRAFPIEVWLAFRFLGEIAAALKHHGTYRCASTVTVGWWCARAFRRSPAAHLRALLLQNCFAR